MKSITKLRCEPLENRLNPVSITLLRGGIVSMVGDNLEQFATVQVANNEVVATISTWKQVGEQGGVPIYAFSKLDKKFPVAQVTRVTFSGLGSQDFFQNETSIPCTARGGEGDDELIGGSGNDSLFGEAGKDILDGLGGNDTLTGGVGNDTYRFASTASMGTDFISEAADLDRDDFSFKDQSSNVTVNLGSTALQTVITGRLSITLSSATGIEDARGGSGADNITGNARNNRFRGGHGNDTLNGAAGNDSLQGEWGNDSITGGDGDDSIYGNSGNDTLRGEAGHDYIATFTGTDLVSDGLGNDRIVFTSQSTGVNFTASSGNDTIIGSSHADVLTGSSGNDEIDGENGHDTINGGSGNDTITGSFGDDRLNGGGGTDRIDGEWGNDSINGGAGNDTLYGGVDNDTLMGGDNNDVLWGLDGDDSLEGQAGTDTMYGGHGYDTLIADMGNETLAGGDQIRIKVPTDSPQTDAWSCGPNSASRLLRSYGINVSYSTLRTDAKNSGDVIPDFGLGTPSDTLESIMKKYRSSTQMDDDAEFDDIISKLKQGRPVLALIGWGSIVIPGPVGLEAAPEKLHWICLTGFDEATQTLYYTDTNGAETSYSYATFQERWTDWSAGPFVRAFLSAIGVSENTIIW